MEVSRGLCWGQYSNKVLFVVELGKNLSVNCPNSDQRHKLESENPK